MKTKTLNRFEPKIEEKLIKFLRKFKDPTDREEDEVKLVLEKLKIDEPVHIVKGQLQVFSSGTHSTI